MSRTPLRYVAFLRGVSPLNAKMPELRRAFELGGFADVETVLGSGNVVFSAGRVRPATLARKAEAAMTKHLGASFFTIVRSVEELRSLLAEDPFKRFRSPRDWKRVATFLAEATAEPAPKLPIALDGARILARRPGLVLSAHSPTGNHGSLLMSKLERTFGKRITTRTWDTVARCAR